MKKVSIVTILALFVSVNLYGQEKGTLIDNRDGQTYNTVQIGNQIWMAENLNYAMNNGCSCYDDDSVNCNKFGRLYNFESAQKSCPSGWHLPSKEEFDTLIDFFSEKSGSKRAKLAFIALAEGGSSGFDMLLGGNSYRPGKYGHIKQYGYLWTSTDWTNAKMYTAETDAWTFCIWIGKKAYIQSDRKEVGRSVRCIKN